MRMLILGVVWVVSLGCTNGADIVSTCEALVIGRPVTLQLLRVGGNDVAEACAS